MKYYYIEIVGSRNREVIAWKNMSARQLYKAMHNHANDFKLGDNNTVIYGSMDRLDDLPAKYATAVSLARDYNDKPSTASFEDQVTCHE